MPTPKLRNFRLYRWLRGGLWIQHADAGWVRGNWISTTPLRMDWIHDERGCGYHRTLLSIVKIEDYTR